MEELKELFGDGSLSYEQFAEKVDGAKMKLVNLETGNYVAKKKYTDAQTSADEYKAKYDELFAKVGDYDKIKADFEEMNTKYGELQAKQDLADKMELVSKANVQPQFAKFVYSEVNGLTNEETDFQTALDKYLQDNKQYLIPAKSTYANLETGGNPVKSANEKMNEFIRRKGR